MLERDSARARTLRAMYPGGRPGKAARRYVTFWAWFFSLGLLSRRWLTLEVRGRKTGKVTRLPLGAAQYQGRWYLLPMLGECNWTRNARAAGGRVILHWRGARPVQLTEMPVVERAPIIKTYLDQVPGARPHIAVDRRAPVQEFEKIAATIPVFRIDPDTMKP